jgi:Ecdysteroid kinase-like family
VKARLSYGPGSPPLPEYVLMKMTLDDDESADVLYETETNIYKKFLPELDILKPTCLVAEYDFGSGTFMLMLEDLSRANAFFPTVLERPLTPAQVGDLLDLLAKLHAQYWNSPRLKQEQDWLSSLSEGRQFNFFEAKTVEWINHYVKTIPYRQDLLTRVGRSVEQLWSSVKAVHRYHEKLFPPTLLHGDTGAHNSYHLPDGSCGFLDWQLSVRSAWPHDVHYLVCTALSVADRRANEKALVQRYLGKLASFGVADVPDINTAMREFGRAIIWGFTIGWFMVPPTNYPPVIVNANLERLFAAVLDHNTLGLADEVASA